MLAIKLSVSVWLDCKIQLHRQKLQVHKLEKPLTIRWRWKFWI